MDQNTFLASLSADLDRLAQLAKSDLSLLVPSCPGWDLARLIGHLGRVQRMALAVVTTGSMEPAPSSALPSPPEDHDNLRAYFADSSEEILDELRSTPSDSPCWTFLGGPNVAGFWTRRMTHEHSIHRYDAELAVGAPRPIPTTVAIDGIEEYILIANTRLLPKVPDFSLRGSLHLHATDGDGEWMITQATSAEGAHRLVTERRHAKADAAIRATASDMMLGLWGRLSLANEDCYDRFGDNSVISALGALGGQ